MSGTKFISVYNSHAQFCQPQKQKIPLVGKLMTIGDVTASIVFANLVPRVLSLLRESRRLQLVTCLLDFSRFQRCIWRERLGSKVCLHWALLLNQVGRGICNPLFDGQNSQRRHCQIQYLSSMRSMLGQKVSSAFGWIFPVDVWTDFWTLGQWKNWQTTWKWPPQK